MGGAVLLYRRVNAQPDRVLVIARMSYVQHQVDELPNTLQGACNVVLE